MEPAWRRLPFETVTKHGTFAGRLWKEFQGQGTLLMIGTFANAQEEGSMAIFTTREAAEAFAEGDPFVLNGVVRRWSVREWNEAIASS